MVSEVIDSYTAVKLYEAGYGEYLQGIPFSPFYRLTVPSREHPAYILAGIENRYTVEHAAT